jgi:hypothetical protein
MEEEEEELYRLIYHLVRHINNNLVKQGKICWA